MWATRLVVMGSLMLLAAGCGGESVGQSLFWDSATPYPGSPGDYPYPPPSLQELYARADAVVAAEVTDLVEEAFSPGWPPSLEATPMGKEAEERLQRFQAYLSSTPDTTVFAVQVQRWVKGSGPTSVTVSQFGHLEKGIPLVFDGEVFLEEGRTYFLFLEKSQGPADYSRIGAARGIFDVSTGNVLVYNYWWAEDLEYLEGMTADQFVTFLKGLSVAQP